MIFVASNYRIKAPDTANEVIMAGMRLTCALSAAGLISQKRSHDICCIKLQNQGA